MIHINSVDHINLVVSNLKESVGFYQKMFNMSVFEEGLSNGKPYQIIGLKDALFLCLYEGEKRGKGPINHIGININSFDEAFKTLKENNVPLYYGGEVNYPESRSLYIEDLDGNSIELSEVFGGGLAS